MSDAVYSPDDFVYVDPEKRVVVAKVEWDAEGNAMEREWLRSDAAVQTDGHEEPQQQRKSEKGDSRIRKPRKRYYPWGSYRSMSKIYRLEGKGKDREIESYIPLEQAIGNLQQDPYWN